MQFLHLSKIKVPLRIFFPPLNFYFYFYLFQNILSKLVLELAPFSILHLLQYNTFFSFTNAKKSSNSQVTENHTHCGSLISMLFDLSLP